MSFEEALEETAAHTRKEVLSKYPDLSNHPAQLKEVVDEIVWQGAVITMVDTKGWVEIRRANWLIYHIGQDGSRIRSRKVRGYFWRVTYIVDGPPKRISSSDGGPYRTKESAKTILDRARSQIEANGHTPHEARIISRPALPGDIDKMEKLIRPER